MRVFLSLCLFLPALLAQPATADAKTRQQRCPFGDGQRIGAGQCIAIKPMQASKWPELSEVEHLQGPALRQFCPNVVLRQHAGGGKINETVVELPAKSLLYDISSCCPFDHLTLTAKPAGHRFSLRMVGRDCFGGTANFDFEETYQLDGAAKASLLRKVDRSAELEKSLKEAD